MSSIFIVSQKGTRHLRIIIIYEFRLELWKKELEAQQPTLLNNDRMRVNLQMYSSKAREGAVSALNLSCTENADNGNDPTVYGLQGSFRKLEVD